MRETVEIQEQEGTGRMVVLTGQGPPSITTPTTAAPDTCSEENVDLTVVMSTTGIDRSTS